MKIETADAAVLERLADQQDELVTRAIAWCAINSGSRNLKGLEAQRAVLEGVMAGLPGTLESVPLADTAEVGADGELKPRAIRRPCA